MCIPNIWCCFLTLSGLGSVASSGASSTVDWILQQEKVAFKATDDYKHFNQDWPFQNAEEKHASHLEYICKRSHVSTKGKDSKKPNMSRRVTLFEGNGPMMPFSKTVSALFVPFVQITHTFQGMDKLSTLPFAVLTADQILMPI
ncbi:hypothetical protein VNO78_10794 [Psophocarpus tetragonolobus]|uniref:Uncharacterized protein n=1 Tax=Psophocarpus tetragonolobus TaxID=3891 RepID=A0AAN9XN25_PSOTE